jgi:hypothetical protein
LTGLALTMAAVAAFNLVCNVEERASTSADDATETTKDVSIVFRIDLDNKRWCSGECLIVHSVVDFNDRHITLAFAVDDTVPAFLAVHIERSPWILNSTSQTADRIVTRLGLCENARFSGFPANSQSSRR